MNYLLQVVSESLVLTLFLQVWDGSLLMVSRSQVWPCYSSDISYLSMKPLLVLGALLLSCTPAFADDKSDHSLFKKNCMGSEEMKDDYRIQKGKYCDCMADFFYIKQTKQSFMEVVEICKSKYPPLN